MTGPGRRDRKKQQTRDSITLAARRMFAENGFDAVTVAEIAAAADVAEATVFNHFRTKEDLFFAGMSGFEDQLIAAVRDRPKGASVLDTFRDLLIVGSGRFAEPDGSKGAALGARLIAESASLRRREIEIVAEYVGTLADLLAEEMDASALDVRPFVIANALMGVHRVLVELARRLATEGRPGADIASLMAHQAECAFAVLGDGLADHGRRP
jgi:AcrR family transcriptional regulator